MKRRAFSLLEILVAVSIAGILLGILFTKVRDFVFLRNEIATAEKECLERQSVQIRLEEVLAKLAAQEKEGEYLAPFYFKDPKVFFQAVRDFDIDASFATELSYTLWLDPQKNILFLSCQTPEGVERKEALAHGVLKCAFRFYSEKESSWQTLWPQNSKNSPSFVHMICKKKNGDIEYLIPVHSSL